MAWMGGIPHDPRPFSGGQGLSPAGCVMHRTIGRWAGDYSVLSRARVPSVHFLVGQDEGQWVQFWDTNWTAAHAAGANEYAVGIEFSGQNGERLTDWQLRAGAAIVQWLNRVHGIPFDFKADGSGRVTFWRGFLNHSNVATSAQYTHYDFIYEDEFWSMVGGASPAPPPAPRPQANTGVLGMEITDPNGTIWWVVPGGVAPETSLDVVNRKHFVGCPTFSVSNMLHLIAWAMDFRAWNYETNDFRYLP